MTAKNPALKTKPAAPGAAPRKPAAQAPARVSQRAARVKPTHKPLVRAKPAKKVAVVTPSSARAPAAASKQARLIALLGSSPGATIEQMMKVTGWQAHTVRGTISGALRKRLGLKVACESADAGGARVYRIVGTPVPV